MKRRSFYFNLSGDFFSCKEVKKIRRTPGGNTCVLIYIEMLIRSMAAGGFLFFDEIEDTFEEEIALDLDEKVEDVRATMQQLEESGLLIYEDQYTARILSPQYKRNRNTREYKAWRRAVFERDDYTCQHCGTRGGDLEAHHVESWAACPTKRFDVENGITLCKSCHKKEHERARD